MELFIEYPNNEFRKFVTCIFKNVFPNQKIAMTIVEYTLWTAHEVSRELKCMPWSVLRDNIGFWEEDDTEKVKYDLYRASTPIGCRALLPGGLPPRVRGLYYQFVMQKLNKLEWTTKTELSPLLCHYFPKDLHGIFYDLLFILIP